MHNVDYIIINKTKWYAYFLSIVLGFIAYIVNMYYLSQGTFISFIIISCVLNSVFCYCFGYLWPRTSLRWGYWFSIPFWLMFFLLNSIYKVELFYLLIRAVHPLLITAISCLFSYYGSQSRIKKIKIKKQSRFYYKY